MSNTAHSSAEVIKLLFTTESLEPRPTEWYVAAHTGDPGIEAADNEVSTGNDANYERQSIEFDLSEASGITSAMNNAEIVFPVSAAAGNYTVRAISIHTAITGGIALAVLPLDPPRVIEPSGIPLRFPINEIIIEGYSSDD
ncbi:MULTISPECIES: hypothetical protein [unclassified Pseudomonas]|uniref:phage tail fiber protein n=1 Tax=unclassified Pseudomonas TaxID=196821 RepID=UPI00244CE9A7|nr:MULTISPECIES: hypothetical protein [unclassified Pseudomonas]MDG9927410.1 hypothetical protein [Pseudomonas sp. GD04042]MDH0482479.1 hypothetical protein [Pseudomonas sp. GD04015]MDH0602831.1 hypothetical protein [Pseudomonas sp. GD03869]